MRQQFTASTSQLATRSGSPENIDAALGSLESGKERALVATTADAWARGDLEKMERYASWCDCFKTPEEEEDFFRYVLTDRNAAMATKIEQVHADGKRVFAAVGALHMIGEKGLPALLAARGFQVTRVLFAERQ